MGEIMAKITAEKIGEKSTGDHRRNSRKMEQFSANSVDRNAELTAEQIQELSRKRAKTESASRNFAIVLPAADEAATRAHPRAVASSGLPLASPNFSPSPYTRPHYFESWYRGGGHLPAFLASLAGWWFCFEARRRDDLPDGKFQDYVTDVLGVAFIMTCWPYGRIVRRLQMLCRKDLPPMMAKYRCVDSGACGRRQLFMDLYFTEKQPIKMFKAIEIGFYPRLVRASRRPDRQPACFMTAGVTKPEPNTDYGVKVYRTRHSRIEGNTAGREKKDHACSWNYPAELQPDTANAESVNAATAAGFASDTVLTVTGSGREKHSQSEIAAATRFSTSPVKKITGTRRTWFKIVQLNYCTVKINKL